MKVGVRTPRVKRRVKARAAGKVKRQIKRATNPFYGKKGMGMIKDPKRAMYNKVYRKTTVSVEDLFKAGSGSSKKRRRKAASSAAYANRTYTKRKDTPAETVSKIGSAAVIAFILGFLCLFSDVSMGISLMVGGAIVIALCKKYEQKYLSDEVDNVQAVEVAESATAEQDVEFSVVNADSAEEQPDEISVTFE